MKIVSFFLGAGVYFIAWVIIGAIFVINEWPTLTVWQMAAVSIPMIVAVIFSMAIDEVLSKK